MDGVLYLDTETTGNDLLTDRLFQVCYKYKDKLYSEYFKPTVPISIKSQSITHVTNKMVKDKKTFSESPMKKKLTTILKDNVLVAHNAVFDIAMLAHEGVSVPRFICTLKVARALDTEGVIPEYNLQYLRYYLELDIEGKAHEAEIDVIVLEGLFKRLYTKMSETHNSHDEIIEKMTKISLEPSLFTVFPFGKHKGKKISEAIAVDRQYVEWLLERKTENPEGEEDWIYTLKHHLNA